MMLQAWGDESMRAVHVDRPSYLFGAVVASSSMAEGIRDEMRELPRRGVKLHWHDQDEWGRGKAMARIATLDVYHVVVVAAPVDPRRQERARDLSGAACLAA